MEPRHRCSGRCALPDASVAGFFIQILQETVSLCAAVLMEVSGSAIDQLVQDNAFYRYATILGGMYKGNPRDVKTFGVGATFITSADVPDHVVYCVVTDPNPFESNRPACNGYPGEMLRGNYLKFGSACADKERSGMCHECPQAPAKELLCSETENTPA